MRLWNITPGDPGQFTLAADARGGLVDYTNDHIWELRHSYVEPPSLALYTTYGLRARSFVVFPRFQENDIPVIDPRKFAQPVTIHHFGPDFVSLSYHALPGIKIEALYWAPDSHTIGGQMVVTNTRLRKRKFSMELAAILSPLDGGERMALQTMEGASVLAGKTHQLFPVLFVSGGAGEGIGPYPSLSFDLDLEAGFSREFFWAVGSRETPDASFQSARDLVQRNWKAENARLERLADQLIHIQTGDRLWDIAFALTQKTALGLLIPPPASSHLPHPSFVVNRTPEQGFSAAGDGRDYQLHWSGQTPFQSNILVDLLGAVQPELARGILDNFISSQEEDGFIPQKIGLAGQRSSLLAMPLLTNMAWTLHQVNPSIEYLREIFPVLIHFIHRWFEKDQDSDGDGIPEWYRSRQSGFSEHPTSVSNPHWSTHPPVSMTEDPALCAMLVHEIQILQKIAHLLEEEDKLEDLSHKKAFLENAILEAFDEKKSRLYRWDRDTHRSPAGRLLGKTTGSNPITMGKTFKEPLRVLIEIQSAETIPANPIISIHGEGEKGEHWVESLTANDFHWNFTVGKALSRVHYTRVDFVHISGVHKQDRVRVHIANYRSEDITLLLPLWSKSLPDEWAEMLIENTITDPQKFWSQHGLKATPREGYDSVHIPWNVLIGKGLIANGKRDIAAELVGRLMKGVIKNLSESGSFYTCYDPQTGQGLLEKNVIDGFAPLGLFLETLGVRLISPREIRLEGSNPFPWPVVINFRGTRIERRKKKTIITFADGSSTQVQGSAPKIIQHPSLQKADDSENSSTR